MSAADLLLWSFLFPLPTLLLSALGLPRRAGLVSFLSPLAIVGVGLGWLVQGATTAKLVVPDLVRFLPDGAFRLTVDPLAGIMLLVVGFVSTCVFIYAQGYMAHDERAHRFFAFLDFFVAAMCLLVVAGNLTVLLIGWTGVGVASFLLISFWWQKDGGAPLKAGYLALGANAIGDAALLLAVVLVPAGLGELTELGAISRAAPERATLLAWCLVIAACAKSAQGPLWWWLPSAMAGPTPVSALIHAATMVAAGVYLLVRTATVVVEAPLVAYVTAWTGVITALLAGLASLWQPNFKRGLAYSTVSQLGWMFTAVAVGAPFAALFHLVTHAAFKAMLFLSAGTVIAATHHEERIDQVGGLAKKLPMAFAFFVLGTAALIGTPLVTAGSFSKDAILEATLASAWPELGWLLLAGAFLTGAYAGRLLFGVFLGAPGPATEHAHHPGRVFDLALLPLAAGAVGLGYLEAGSGLLSGLVHEVVAAGEPVHVQPTLLGIGAFAIGLVGVGAGALLARTRSKCLPLPAFTGVWQALWGEAHAIPQGAAALHSGRISRYALVSVLGVAVAMGVAVAPVAGQDAPPAVENKRRPFKPNDPRKKKDAERQRKKEQRERERRERQREREKQELRLDASRGELRPATGLADPNTPEGAAQRKRISEAAKAAFEEKRRQAKEKSAKPAPNDGEGATP